MSKFFTNDTNCLYLDQFAVSRICVSSPPGEWKDISALIKQGVDTNKLICPTPFEQMIETTGLDRESAKSLDKESRKLSLGWSFFSELDVSAHYFICKVRNIQMSKRHFIHRIDQKFVDESNVYEELGKRNATFRRMIDDATTTVNIFRTAARGGVKGKKQSREILVEIIKDKYAGEMKERLYLLGTQGRYTPRTVTLAGQNILFWADALCSVLINKHSMTQQEAINAYNALQKEGIEAVPSLSIRASLEAMKAYKGANENPNDQVDIMRIASALPFADIMLIDGPKASEVRELGLDKKFGTTIYSGKRLELVNLEKELDNLINKK